MNDYITNIATVRITAEDNIIIKIQLRTPDFRTSFSII